MTEAQLAIVISGVALAGQVANAFLKRSIRADLLEMKDELLDKLDGRFVSKEVCESRRCVYSGISSRGIRDVAG